MSPAMSQILACVLCEGSMQDWIVGLGGDGGEDNMSHPNLLMLEVLLAMLEERRCC